ncbi:MAG TPA: MBL fold metallo-hydrolase [Gammaproteobacteria bacterium]|nr:MBL fold metallo-hydrolase [Gammaproteobacteria bacterium]
MKSSVIAESGKLKWIVLGRDADKSPQVIDTNQYLIVCDGQGMLLDPGGIEIFPRVLAELTRHLALDRIRVLFASHQDPDIISSLPLWLDLNPQAVTYCSWLWTGFIAHFATGKDARIEAIPDYGMRIPLPDTGAQFLALPAHYCHSSGNFSLFDETTRTLFSGDVGAALLPGHDASLYVDDLRDHVRYMEAFHRRWMPSTTALRGWVARVRALEPRLVCPQHGAIFRGPAVAQLFDWLDGLEVGQWDEGDAAGGEKSPWRAAA